MGGWKGKLALELASDPKARAVGEAWHQIPEIPFTRGKGAMREKDM